MSVVDRLREDLGLGYHLQLRHQAAAEIERLQRDRAYLQSTLESILTADWRTWEELARPEEFVRWAKARAQQALHETQEEAL